MSTELPEARYVPYEASDPTGAGVLVLAPHPDDETLSCGGTIGLHRAAGDPVHVAFTTSGDQGDWSRERSPEDIRLVREAEAGRALFELGVESWEFWRLPDRGVVADGPLVERIHDAILRTGATLVYCPSPLDSHPDHRALAQALRLAVAGWPGELDVAWYEFSVGLPVNRLVDIAAGHERKWRAMAHYGSQLESPHDYEAAGRGLEAARAITLAPAAAVAEGFRVTPARSLEGDRIWRWAALQEPERPSGEAAVSVVLRTRNRPEFLRAALGSLSAQTMKDFEVVVVNDGGADVGAVLAEFAELRIVAETLPARVGPSEAANAGVRAARAELIAYLDDDDVYLPGHLEALRDALDRHPQRAVAFTDVDLVRMHWDADRLDFAITSRSAEFTREFDADRLLYENSIPNVALMHRRDAWERVGGFDPELDLLEDWDFLIRLAAEYVFVHVPRRTAEYRLREGNSRTGPGPWAYPEYLRAREQLFERYRDRYTPEVQMRVFHAMSDAGEAARAELATQRHRLAQLEAQAHATQVDAERLTWAECIAADLNERVAELTAEVAATHRTNGHLTSANGNGNGNGAAGREVAVRRVLGALRHPDRVVRWAQATANDPQLGLDRLRGR